MTTIAILSDDLTGAADTGIQFVQAGLEALVLLNAGDDPAPEAAVLVGVSESRNDSADAARRKVAEWAGLLARRRPETVYKKIDSTLRGNLGAELDACMDAFPGRVVILAPAYPAAGRTTVDGRHYVHGVPLEQTEVARDPIMPVRDSEIPRLLSRQTRRRIGQVLLSDLRMGPEGVARALREQVTAGAEILVCDSRTDQDLADLAAAVRTLGRPVIWTGSAGLARQLAQTARCGACGPETAPVPTGPLLVIAGSVSRTLRRQVKLYCERTGAACIVASSEALAGPEAQAEAEVARAAGEAVKLLRTGRSAVVTTSVAPERITPGPQMLETARAISDRLGQIARRIYEAGCTDAMVLSGGDTALGVCRSLGAVGLRLQTELLPGVAQSALVGGPCAGLIVITKAGSFGEEDVLCQISHMCQPHTPA